MSYELLPHTADIRARLTAPDLPGLYAAAVDLVRDVLVGDSPVAAGDRQRVALETDDPGERLFRFVRELVYLNDVDGFVPGKLVDLEGSVTVVAGEPFDPAQHEVHHQVKAVTRHGYTFRESPEGYEAEMVFDL